MSDVDNEETDMRKEYDLSNSIRTSKYADRYAQGTNVVLLDPDLAKVFSDSRSVNEALRVILKASERVREASSPS